VTELSPEQEAALAAAHDLIDWGVPLFTAFKNHGPGGEFILPSAWPDFRPNHRQVEIWRPGHALCMVTGVVFDVIDIDPRNGGQESARELATALGWDVEGGPRIYGVAFTPSEGEHHLIGRTGLRKGKPAKGVDLQAGDDHGEGRGFVYIAPTVRVSKYGMRQGQEVAYRWRERPQPPQPGFDPGLTRFRDYVVDLKPARNTSRDSSNSNKASRSEDDLAFGDFASDWTATEADKLISQQLDLVQAAKDGEINSTLGGAARVLGRFVAGGYRTEDEAVHLLMSALKAGGVHSDAWNAAHGKDWTAATVIAAGLANGADEPWTVDDPVDIRPQSGGHSQASSLPADMSADATATPSESRSVSTVAPRLEIMSAADSAYWLQGMLGAGPLSGFFSRGGQVTHTPRVDETGYVAAPGEADDNGPAQIQAVSAGQLAAKIQYAYACYKTIKGKKEDPDIEVPALFPLQAAQRAVDAPESMGSLRPLAGITLTPMVRADGSVLGTPGYDPASRYLFLPGSGVDVPEVPAEPTAEDVTRAVALLDEMVAGFPWETKDDRTNYLGFLLTPMLRLMCPPSYKLFGIGAHQPGSGKTLLADIATALHGSVFRSEAPEDEPEWRKQTSSMLAATSAPVIIIDNVTGTLKSSVLAGLLTASAPTTDREVGSAKMVTTVNDRVWCVTGNNLVLSGDLVRRTIIINIDPNTASPETREFAIADLPSWVRAHRNELLWSLLVMIRHWVAIGRPMVHRAQSDSFARWETVVGSILAACGIEGDFDRESGKRAAAGGDDDGLATLLSHLYDRFESVPFTVAEALDGTEAHELGDFVAGSRDWLPERVLGMMARSEASGRKSLGRFLLYSIGRWVSDGERSLAIRRLGTPKRPQWRVDKADN
jgi:hypothetical protein